jgi:hypothetical protein
VRRRHNRVRIYKADVRRGHQVICPETPWQVVVHRPGEEISLHQAVSWNAALNWLAYAWPVLNDYALSA